MHGRVVRTLAALAVVALLSVGAALSPTGPKAEAADRVAITASDSSADSDAQALTMGRRSGKTWSTAGRIRGVQLRAAFSRETAVDGMRIDGASASLRIADARIEFSDGSALAVRTDARGDRVVHFRTRTVRWVRLVVVAAGSGQTSVGLAGWTLHRGRSTAAAPSAAVRPAEADVSSGSADGTRWSASTPGADQWIRAELSRPMEISAIRIRGAATSSSLSIRAADLRFSDGSMVPIGALEAEGGAPTTVAFTPRVTRAVQLIVTAIAPTAYASVESIQVFPVGVVPAEPDVATPTFHDRWEAGERCTGIRVTAPTSALRLLCPSNGRASGPSLRMVVSAPARSTVTAAAFVPDAQGGAVRTVATTTASAKGAAELLLPSRRLLHGPTAARITASGVGTPLYLQFMNRSGVVLRAPSSRPARGMDLKFSDTFDAPLSATRDGAAATYSSGKPNSFGVDDFGEAIFAQPSRSVLSTSTMPGGYLRIPARALAADETDPAPYGRRAAAGLISSAHMGGSGFSAEFGYFEVRMLAPAGRGTWPAFWMLSTDSLVRDGTTGELDAVELYGNEPRDVYQTPHSWGGSAAGLRAVHLQLPAHEDTALVWHTFGAKVTPAGTDFYIDGVRTGRTGPTVDQAEPFFFLANLALKAGWNEGLAPTAYRADLFIDYIRVWV